MAYGQINYSHELGNGPYSIADAGCFLTAFSNLLQRFGQNIDPPSLNDYFVAHNSYVDVDGDRTLDDLAWGTVSAYDGQIGTVAIGGAGWPDSNDAIVKFLYKSSRSGQLITHFCLVADHNTHTIVDSWDGNVKVSPYGTPVAWAKYERHQPQVVTPPPAPEQAAYTIESIPEKSFTIKTTTHLWNLNQRSWPALVNNPLNDVDVTMPPFKTTQLAHHVLGGSYYIPEGLTDAGYNTIDCREYVSPPPVAPPSAPLKPGGNPDNKYDVIKEIPGYSTATNAGNHIGSTVRVPAGTYFVYNTYPGNNTLINVTSKLGVAGAWINTEDNVPDAPPSSEVPVPEPSAHIETEPATSTNSLPWQDTFRPFPKPVHYISTRAIVVADLSGQQPDMSLPKYSNTGTHEVGVVSAFGKVEKDGIEWYRLKSSNDPDYHYWYCVPVIDPDTHTPNLLVKPVEPAAPVKKITVARDGLELSMSKVEHGVTEFLDDILPKWFKNKKK
jgi:hypothetical protein